MVYVLTHAEPVVVNGTALGEELGGAVLPASN